MSSDQLRSIFHVDSQDLVPHYEVIRLTHHGTIEHSISKRSIDHHQQLTKTNAFADIDKSSQSKHHVKKDLSKSAYYSELKSHNGQRSATLNRSDSNKKITNFSSSNIGNSYQEIPTVVQQSQQPKIDLINIKEHNVSLSAFGQMYNLTLRPTDGLFKNGPQNVKMFGVNSNANFSDGLDYEPIVSEVSLHAIACFF